MKKHICALAVLSGLSFSAMALDCYPSLLPSWKDGASKTAIVNYVDQSLDTTKSTFIPEQDRIAVFDNDGTLWSEKPFYFQLAYALDEVKIMAKDHPEWKTQEPFKSVLNDDIEGVFKGGEKALLEIVKVTHSGMTVEEYQEKVAQWLKAAKDPRFGKAYTELTYKPMREMVTYLQEHGFKTYIVSGGGVDFMRVWAPEVYGIPEEQIIGSALKYKYDYNDGKPTVTKLGEILTIDDKAGKVENIQHIIGKKPVLAIGNSDGDHAMMQWATSQPNSMAMIVHHTDEDREWKYDRKSSVGHLDKAMDEANQRDNWHLIDMKNEWCTVY
ncbi:haloacid dehalogenase-like hydrolase [Vibrio sp. B1ASS3]|uniref:HAD family hydrolase n=1 Tax=Vibrio sp. B1ASS3 TaxID=2751176 RepID=UPI001ABABAC3|nr:HAD family hydrolase [Vibrio sp. B1ASS3]CAD7826069.1 haloacid dehalogenase-like hydrolase [Vibrio sp. B1ASS3]CAE6959568.1 haloacid dehalogenase-like hydrolase [Vibrio sp. B1ASS3]